MPRSLDEIRVWLHDSLSAIIECPGLEIPDEMIREAIGACAASNEYDAAQKAEGEKVPN